MYQWPLHISTETDTMIPYSNLTTAIHFILASHRQISTNFNAFKTHWHASLQHFKSSKYQHITPTLKKLHWLPIKQRIDYKICLLTYKTFTNQQPTYLYNSLSFPSLSRFYKIFWFTRSFHSICHIIIWQKGFLCRWSTILEFTNYLLIPEIWSLFQAQNTLLQNCIPS